MAEAEAAFKETQSAIVTGTVLADLVRETINQRVAIQDPCQGPCHRLFNALGIKQCNLEVELEVGQAFDVNAIDQPSCSQTSVHGRHWHSWLVPALAADSSEDELDIYKRNSARKSFKSFGSQTEPVRTRKHPGVVTPGDRSLLAPAPCELNRQTIYIDAVPTATPNVQGRPPLTDRFCYMLTDFASALYCSLAIMCCCTPSMFR